VQVRSLARSREIALACTSATKKSDESVGMSSGDDVVKAR
jgi:hypothetical protein